MRLLFLIPIVAIAALTCAAADVQYYLVVKGLNLEQTNAAAPVVVTNESPFRLVAEVLATDTNSVTNATVMLPSKLRVALTNVANADAPADWVLEQGFTNKAQLDTRFPAGNYTLIIQTLNSSNNALLKMPRDAYPARPHIANWQDAQEIESELPGVIQWDLLAKGSSNDLVALDIQTTNGTTIASSSEFFQPDALNGTNVALVIPAGVLEPGQTYTARLLVIKVAARNTNSVPSTTGVAGYYCQTTFPVTTLPEPESGGRIQLSARTYVAGETSGQAMVTVTRVGDEGNPVGVNLATADGTATNGVNYLGVNTALTFDAGQTSTNVAIPILNDYELTGDRTVNLVLSDLTGNAVYGSRSNAVLTIVDSQKAGAGALQFYPVNYTVSESASTLNLTVKRFGGSSGMVGVHFQTVDGTAQAGQDYVATNGSLVFASGKTSLTVPVHILNNSIHETNAFFYLALDATTGGAALGTNRFARVTILDNDPGGTVSIATSSYVTNEDAGFFYVTVRRTGTGFLASNASVDFATLDGSALAGLDYMATNGTLTFGTNQSARTIAIPMLADTNANGYQNFSFRISNPQGGAIIGTNSKVTLTIQYTNPCICISNASYSISEAGTNLTIHLVRFGPLTDTAAASFTTLDGTAVSPTDYRATNGTAQFPPGVSVRSVTLPIVDNTIVQSNRSFYFAITNVSDGTPLGNTSNAVVTIVDNDFPGVIQFATTNFSGYEGSNAVIRVSRTGGLASGITCQFSMTNGTGFAGIDYSNLTQTVSFGAGMTNVNVLIPLLVNPLNVSFKTAVLSLSNPTGGATLGTNQTAVLKIQNNPNLNKVPLNGPLFISGTINGAAFSSQTNSCTASSDPNAALTLNANWNSLTTSDLFANQLSISIFPRPTGTILFNYYSTTDSASFQSIPFSNPLGTRTWAAGGNNPLAPGGNGAFTIDAIDYTQKLASGRFTLQLQEITGGVTGGPIYVSGSFRVALVP